MAKKCLKAECVVFELKPGHPAWPVEILEPLTISVFYPYIPHILWDIRRSKYLFDMGRSAQVPAWASGSERDTSEFLMLGVTGLVPQFRKPKSFWKGRLQVFRPTRSSEFSRCWVMVSFGVLV